jgi:hypothetical protein
MDLKLSLAQLNILDYLIVRIRQGSTEVTRQVVGPHPPTNNNLVFLDIDPGYYLVDVYESADGVALTAFLNTFEINASSDNLIYEFRYYVVDRGGQGDPVDQSMVLDDAYLDGKTVDSVEQRAVGKLRPPTDIVPEWIRTATGISLVDPSTFNTGDTYVLGIKYLLPGNPPVTQKGPFSDEITVSVNSNQDATYYNKLINCLGTSSRLVITMDSLANIPDKTQFYFVDQGDGPNDSQQIQTVIQMQTGEKIRWANRSLDAIWIGRGECCQLKKINGRLKVVNEMTGMMKVGTRFSATTPAGVLNVLPEDGSVHDAADYPRLWWFINTWFTANEVDTSYDFVTLGTAGRAYQRMGQFMISATYKKFAMPDTRGFSEKGLKTFSRSTFGQDVFNRPVDYPGGVQVGQVGQFVLAAQLTQKAGTGNRVLTVPANPVVSGGDPVDLGKQNTTLLTGLENRVPNFGVIYLRYV